MTKQEFESLSGERVTTKQFEIINEWYMDAPEEKEEFAAKVSRSIVNEISEAYLSTYQDLVGVVMASLSTMDRIEIARRVRRQYIKVKSERLNSEVYEMYALSHACSDVIGGI